MESVIDMFRSLAIKVKNDVIGIYKSLRTRLMESGYWALRRTDQKTFVVGIISISVPLFFGIFADFLAPYSPYTIHTGDGHIPPFSSEYLLGTDALGRDILSRIMYGARVSLLVGLAAVSFAGFIGGTLGVITGYFGGIIDRVFTVPMDAMYSFPTFLTALLVSTVLGGGPVYTALAVGFAMIPRFYRAMRSASTSLREESFVEAEISIGASDFYIIFKHIYPLCSSVLLVIFTINIATGILTISGLGFLGLGVPTPIPEWGRDLNAGRPYLLSGVWWTSMMPAVFIFLTVFGFNLVGDALNKILGVSLEEI